MGPYIRLRLRQWSVVVALIIPTLLVLAGCTGFVTTPVHTGGSGPIALSISVTALPSGQARSAYSANLEATGGTVPYAWSVSSGSLPQGLTLNGSGQITGTPTTAGTYSFTMAVTDSSFPAKSASANMAITITAAAASLQITVSSLADGQTDTAYSASLVAIGGIAPYTWSLSSGSLPAGLTLGSSGQISGTPTTAGTSSFIVTVSDSSSPAQNTTANLSIAITAGVAPLQITTSSLPGGVANSSYSATESATGGKTPYSWSVSSGSLPGGLALSTSGQISGTPTMSGTYSFTVQVTDSSSPAQKATKIHKIPVGNSGKPLQITTTSLPTGVTNTSYTATLAATGGHTPYSWSVSSGSLPTGLAVNSSGQISGTPAAVGTFSFTVSLVDSSAPTQSVTADLNITVTTSVTPIQITTSSLAAGQASTAYSASLAASGGKTPYSWSLSSGSLSAGLTLGSSGQISGTPTTAGTSSFMVKVTDSSSTVQSATANLSITISTSVTPVQVTTSTLAGGQTSTAYSASLAASGGKAPYSWSLSSGSLPAGLTLGSSGQISGTPTTAGTSSFTVKVNDSSSPAQSATANLNITVTTSVTPIQITTSSLAAGQTSTAYSALLAASGGQTPYSWSLSSGSLPAGLTLGSSGQISGTPTTAGTSSFTVKVTDSSSTAQSATANLSITISTSVTAVRVTTSTLAAGQTSTAYSASLAASGGQTPYSWSLSSGSLPAGLTLGSSGQISGTPTTAGTSSFTVKVTDSSSTAQSATANLSITIASGITPVQITTSSLAAGQTSTAYSASLAASGGQTPYGWSVTGGSLPTGLSLSGAGQISGTPTTAGTSSFTVKVTDSSST